MIPGRLGLTRGSEFYVGLYPIYKQLFRIFLRAAMLIMWYYYKIILLEKGLMIINIRISSGKNCFLFIQDLPVHVLYYIVQIVFIMTPLSWFYHTYCSSGERCGPWASCFICVLFKSNNATVTYTFSLTQIHFFIYYTIVCT